MELQELFEIHLNAKQSVEISLSEIDPKIIKLIRAMKKKNHSDYKQLKNAIEKDGQQQPIIIRELRSEEKEKLSNSKSKKIKYGIIDGHHRYMIAEELGKNTILAVIDNGQPSEELSKVRDLILAMRFNESSIKMTSIQKGSVIYDLLNTMTTEQTKEIVADIGLKLFGLKPAMTYRCIQNYKKSNGIETAVKPRDYHFDKSLLDTNFSNLPKDLENISAESGLEYLDNIKIIEQQLKYLKQKILSVEEVKNAIKAKKQGNIERAREKKTS